MFIEVLSETEWRNYPINITSGHVTDVPNDILEQIGLIKYFKINILDENSENYWERSEVDICDYTDAEKIKAFERKDRMTGISQLKNTIIGLEEFLDNDYRKNKYLDGEFTPEEWDMIAGERRAARRSLREYKILLETELYKEIEQNNREQADL